MRPGRKDRWKSNRKEVGTDRLEGKGSQRATEGHQTQPIQNPVRETGAGETETQVEDDPTQKGSSQERKRWGTTLRPGRMKEEVARQPPDESLKKGGTLRGEAE